MNTESFLQWARWSARAASGLVIVAGILVLLGWSFDIEILKSGFSRWPKMAAISAFTFVLAGTALGCATATNRFVKHRISQVFSGAVLLISLLKLSEHLAGRSLGIDRLLFLEPPGTPLPFGMAPATALSFLLLGSGLLLATASRSITMFQVVTMLGGFVGWLGFSNYLFGGQAFLPQAEMAVHTALSFLILSLGVYCLRTDGGLMALLTSDTAGGATARRLVPAALLVPIAFGWVRLEGQRAGWYGSETGLALFALANVLVFGGLIWRNAALLDRTDFERRQAEASRLASQGLLQALADYSGSVIYVKDLKGRYLLVNRRYEELFHVRREEMAGRTDYDVFPKENADAYRAADQRALAAGAVVEVEEVAPHDDGPHTYLSIKYPLRDATGEFYAVGGISTDITERKRAEQALRESQERIRAIIDTALDAIIVMDHEGRIVEFNPAAERIFGHSGGKVVGRLLADVVIPPALREQHRRGLTRYLATGEGPVLGKRMEVTGLRSDGSEFPLELSIKRMPGEGPPVFTGFLRDIADRQQAERRVQAQLERLKLLDQITRAIGERHDLHSIFQVVIRTLEDSLPIDFGSVCLYDAVAEALTVTCVGARSEALAIELAMTKQARIEIDQNGLSRCVRGQLVYEPDISGIQFPFPQRLWRGGLRSLVAAPLLFESKIFGILIAARHQADGFSSGDCEFLRQLSEHVGLAAHQAQVHAALQRAYDDLRQTQQAVLQQERLRALGQMASGIAHDINNAVSPVALYTEWILEKEPNLSARTREYLETTQRAIDDVAQTVTRMKEFYRQREAQSAFTRVHVNQLVQQVMNLSRARWSDMPQQRGIVIQTQLELAPDLPAIAGVESEVREALINLIFNAVDAMPTGGMLTVRTRGSMSLSPSEPAYVHVEVIDNGIGMSEETRRRCLEPFFTTKGERGTGLGLAMVYGVTQRHSAEIEIESAVGKGTMARLSFPVPSGTAPETVQPSHGFPLSARLRILVVDDDPLMIKSLRDTLEADGHIVTAANGGQEGIDTLREAQQRGDRFDIVITDLGMPYVDGRKVAGAVKTASPRTPVILLTGWGQRLDAEGDIPAHVDRVLNKPPKLRELRAALTDLVGNPNPMT